MLSKLHQTFGQTAQNIPFVFNCCYVDLDIFVWRFFIEFNSQKPYLFNPLRPNSDLSQTSHCNIKGLSVRVGVRIENMITQVKFS